MTSAVRLDLNMGGKFLRPECANTIRAHAGQSQWGGGGIADGFDSYNQQLVHRASQTIRCPQGADNYAKVLTLK